MRCGSGGDLLLSHPVIKRMYHGHKDEYRRVIGIPAIEYLCAGTHFSSKLRFQHITQLPPSRSFYRL
eukprot:scaffold7099_cov67-Skeletonema_dohrnii-CCMP3373.AAC.1